MLKCRVPTLLPMRTLSSTPSLFSLNHSPYPNPAVKPALPAPTPPGSPISYRLPRTAMPLSSYPIPTLIAVRNPSSEFNNGNEFIDVSDSPPALLVVSFYKFADFHDHASLRQALKRLCEELPFNWLKKTFFEKPAE